MCVSTYMSYVSCVCLRGRQGCLLALFYNVTARAGREGGLFLFVAVPLLGRLAAGWPLGKVILMCDFCPSVIHQ